MSIATVSLKSLADGIHTTGLLAGFLYRRQISHCEDVVSIAEAISSFNLPALLRRDLRDSAGGAEDEQIVCEA